MGRANARVETHWRTHRAGARPSWHIPGDHIDLVPYLVPVGVLVNPCPTPCLGDAWAPGDDLEIFPPSPWYPVPLP